MDEAFRIGWSVVKKNDRCGGCGKPTFKLGIKDEGQADGQMVDVGGGPPMWLCDDCKHEHDERGA